MTDCAHHFNHGLGRGPTPCGRNAWKKDGKYCYAHSSLTKHPLPKKNYQNKNYQTLRKEIIKLDPQLGSGTDDLNRQLEAAIVMFAALEVGTDTDKIHEYLGAMIPKYRIRGFGQNLRNNGVWRDGATYADWADEENGTIAFFCDVGVALGWLTRT